MLDEPSNPFIDLIVQTIRRVAPNEAMPIRGQAVIGSR